MFTSKAGHDPKRFAPLALANMTGGNRLLIGVGWSLVVLLAAWKIRRTAATAGYTGEVDTGIALDRAHSIEIAFLIVATLYSLTLPLKRTLTLVDAAVLIILFVLYLVRITRAPSEEPDLVGPALAIGQLPTRPRRIALAVTLSFAAAVIFACAEPFADALVHTGERFGISTFVLVQWLAPLASESPELVVAGVFAWRLNTNGALGALVSSKVNQWTLLVGSLPLAYLLGGGGTTLVLDPRQIEEMLLTATQTLMGVAVILALRFHRWSAWALLALFVIQFPITSTTGRLILCGAYAVIALGALVVNRGHLLPTLTAPFIRRDLRRHSRTDRDAATVPPNLGIDGGSAPVKRT